MGLRKDYFLFQFSLKNYTNKDPSDNLSGGVFFHGGSSGAKTWGNPFKGSRTPEIPYVH